MVESQPSKLLVAGSIPVSRSSFQHLHVPSIDTIKKIRWRSLVGRVSDL